MTMNRTGFRSTVIDANDKFVQLFWCPGLPFLMTHGIMAKTSKGEEPLWGCWATINRFRSPNMTVPLDAPPVPNIKIPIGWNLTRGQLEYLPQEVISNYSKSLRLQIKFRYVTRKNAFKWNQQEYQFRYTNSKMLLLMESSLLFNTNNHEDEAYLQAEVWVIVRKSLSSVRNNVKRKI